MSASRSFTLYIVTVEASTQKKKLYTYILTPSDQQNIFAFTQKQCYDAYKFLNSSINSFSALLNVMVQPYATTTGVVGNLGSNPLELIRNCMIANLPHPCSCEDYTDHRGKIFTTDIGNCKFFFDFTLLPLVNNNL